MIKRHLPAIGFGNSHATINCYIANRPPIDNYPYQDYLAPLALGEIAHIVQHTSNHWRKAFNVFAKLLFELEAPALYPTWQGLRDQQLFQVGCCANLLFSEPLLSNDAIHIVFGKTYAQTLNLPPLTWLDAHFAVNHKHKLIVSPYPDYRQLTNERIFRLVALFKNVASDNTLTSMFSIPNTADQ